MTSIGGLTTTTGVQKYHCHSGNVSVMHVTGGGILYCGGWSRLADGEGIAVIDLTGNEKMDGGSPIVAKNTEAEKMFEATIASASGVRTLPWLSFPIRDFGVPVVEKATWVALSNDIYALMNAGVNVLIACNGGHGRTGTAAAIICRLLNDSIGDPVKYLRGVYCDHAVETRAQHEYVHKMLDLPDPPQMDYKHEYKSTVGAAGSAGQYWGGYGGFYGDGDWKQTSSPPKNGTPTSGEQNKTDKGGMIPVQAMSFMEREHFTSVLDSNKVDCTKFSDVRGVWYQVAILIDNSVEFFEITDFDRASEEVLMAPIEEPGKEVIAKISELAKVAEMDAYYAQPNSKAGWPKG